MRITDLDAQEREKFKEDLYRLYIVEDKWPTEIAKIYECDKHHIQNYLKMFGIPSKRPPAYQCPKVGDKFNRWTFIEEIRERKKDTRWKCKCECGNIRIVVYRSILNGDSKSCGCYHADKMRGIKWSGYEEMSGGYLWTIKDQARRRKHEYSVSDEYLWNLFLKQDGKCALTGTKLFFSKNLHKEKQNASLDRIDSFKGYIEGNVRWVTKEINYAKRQMDDKDFYLLCKSVVEFNKEKYESKSDIAEF